MTVPNGTNGTAPSKVLVPNPVKAPRLTIIQGSTFLFTSESVGEGHPDKIWYVTVPPLSIHSGVKEHVHDVLHL